MRTEKREFTVFIWDRKDKDPVEIIHRPNSREERCHECGQMVAPGDGHLWSAGKGRTYVWHVSCFLEKQSKKYPEPKKVEKPKLEKPLGKMTKAEMAAQLEALMAKLGGGE